MRCGASIILLAAALGSGCISVSSGADGKSTGNGIGSSGNGGTSSGGTSAGTIGTTTGGGPSGVALIVDPNPINFGFDEWGHTAVGCTTVTNLGLVSVEILSADDFENDAGAFALSQIDDAMPPNPAPVPATIASGASANVCFSFNPPITQQYSGQATLETSDGPGPVVQLTGWGGGPQWSCLPTRIDFGQTLDHPITAVPIICTGGIPPASALDLMLVDSGVPGLTAWFDPPEPDGGFRSGPSDGGLWSEVTIQIDLSYSPPNCSDFGGTLIVETRAGKPWFEFRITGQGLCLPCELAFSPPSLDFGNFAVGETSPTLTTSIQNVGSYPCEIDGFKIEGDSTDSFQITSTSVQFDPDAGRIVLLASDAGAAASSMLVQTSFTPPESGVFGAQLSIATSSPFSPDVPLAGTSESTCLAVTPASLAFGDAGPLQFSVSDSCPTPALLQSITLQSGPGDFSPQYSTVTCATLPALIFPGAPVTCALSCAPTSPGSHPAQLILSDGNVETLLWLTCSSP